VSAAVDWSDSRKRSRFTTAGGAAISAIPMADLRRALDELHVVAACQLAALDDAGDPARTHCGSPDEEPLCPDKRSAVRRRLHEIDEAEHRIDDGSYGACFGCGRPVPLSRLKALPYTRYCQDCARHHTEVPMSEWGCRLSRRKANGEHMSAQRRGRAR
jgi:DnaK suppressor protein